MGTRSQTKSVPPTPGEESPWVFPEYYLMGTCENQQGLGITCNSVIRCQETESFLPSKSPKVTGNSHDSKRFPTTVPSRRSTTSATMDLIRSNEPSHVSGATITGHAAQATSSNFSVHFSKVIF